MDLWRSFIQRIAGTVGIRDGYAFALGKIAAADLPTCNAARQFEERVIPGAAGVADRKVRCEKDAANAFAWNDVGFAALDTRYVNVAGDTMSGDLVVPDEVYGVAWNASLEVPTKNALYDKIETIAASGTSPFIDPKDVAYGAVGDGVTNDTTALQSAITAAIANKKILFLSQGDYKITAALTINGPITIMGAGRRLSTITLSSTTLNAIEIAISVSAVSDYGQVHFSNFGIIGSASTPTAGDLINVQTTSANPVEAPLFRDLWLQNGYNGIHIVSGASYTIDNCVFYAQWNDGVILQDTASIDHGDGVITNNTFLGWHVTAGMAAVRLKSGGGVRFSDNVVAAYDYGIYIVLDASVATSELFITNNRINLVDLAAIKIAKGTGTEFNTVTITGNKLMSKGKAIDLSDVNTGWLYGVTMTGNVLWGYAGGTPTLVDIATATDFVLADNTFIAGGTTPIAINIGSNATGAVVNNNIGSGFTTRIANASSNVMVVLPESGGLTVRGTVDEQVTTSAGTAQTISRFGADAFGAFLTFRKSRNATIGSHTIVSSGDELGYLSFQGSDGSNYDEAARITATVATTPGAGTDMPGKIVFATSPDGSATVVERMALGITETVVNDTGTVTNFRVESDTNQFAILVDGTNDRVGILNGSPAVALDVTGEARVSTAGTNAASVVTVGGTQTLTAKTLTTPTIASFTNATHDHSNAAGGGSTLTSPTIVTPTIASFTNATHNHSNAAGGGATLTSPTIVTPTIASFTNAQHNHSNAAGGGTLATAALTDFNSAGDTRWVNVTGDTMTGQLMVDGGADQIQVLVQGNGTQTSDFVVVENSSGTDLVTVASDGSLNTWMASIAGTGLAINRYGADAFGAYLKFQKSRNTTQGSHTIANNGDELGYIGWFGSDGTNYDEAARIQAVVDGAPSAGTDMPGRLEFWTSPDGSATVVKRATIKAAGGFIYEAGSATADSWPRLTTGTVLTTPVAGTWEFDTATHYLTSEATPGRTAVNAQTVYRLTGDSSALASASIADYFPASSSVLLAASAVYELTFHCVFTKTTAGTLIWTMLASSAPTAMSIGHAGADITGSAGTAAAATTVATVASGSLTTGVKHYHEIKSVVETNAACNVRLRVTPSAGTVTPLRGSFYTCRRLPAGNTGLFAT